MILIIDFGSQYTQLLARRIREMNVYSEIVPYKNSERIQEIVSSKKAAGIIFSGGPHSVYAPQAPRVSESLLACGLPVLGVCYGFQLINVLLGGEVGRGAVREYGAENLKIETKLPALHPLAGVKSGSQVWMSHGDSLEKLAPNLNIDAHSTNGIPASFHHKSLPIYGLQFHPEVAHSEQGALIIKNFVKEICHAPTDWDSQHAIEKIVSDIRARADVHTNKNVICALSGGVDSMVAAVLTQRAVGSRLRCFYIDTGLMRKNESAEVMANCKSLGLNVECIDASETFLSQLRNVADPESKRKIIGRAFIETFEHAALEIPNADFLVQGTLYTDVIESVSIHGTSVTIKSHHNVGGLPEKMKFKLIEPLRELFKDEVRRIGRDLGIPANFIDRHPFPGPGLAIRILGDVSEERLSILREADAILTQELRTTSLYNSVWQAFVVLLPVQSVGVMGDERTYHNACVIRCVDASDGMTATWSRLPYEFLAKVSNRITNEVKGINRVTFDITSKPPATIEWE